MLVVLIFTLRYGSNGGDASGCGDAFCSVGWLAGGGDDDNMVEVVEVDGVGKYGVIVGVMDGVVVGGVVIGDIGDGGDGVIEDAGNLVSTWCDGESSPPRYGCGKLGALDDF